MNHPNSFPEQLGVAKPRPMADTKSGFCALKDVIKKLFVMIELGHMAMAEDREVSAEDSLHHRIG